MRFQTILFILGVLFAGCAKNDDDKFSPIITGIEPNAAGKCGWLKIEGSFDTLLANNQVSIGGASAEVVFASDTMLVVRVPENAASGVVTVTTDGETATASENFTLLKGHWNRLPDFPGAARFQASGFVIGEKIYFGTGSQGSVFYDDFWEFDPATGAWTQKATYPGGKTYLPVGFSIGDKGYLGLGHDGNPAFYRYDPATDVWTPIANYPGGNRSGALAFSMNGKAYVGGGLSNNNEYGFWQYDPDADAWSKLPSDPPAVERYAGVGFVIENQGFIGAGGYGDRKDFHAYDPAAQTWSPVAELPSENYKFFSNAMVIGNRAYVRIYHEFWSYDPAADAWTQVAAPCGSPVASERGFSVGGKPYLICGLGASPFGLQLPGIKFWDTNEVWEFTPED